MTQSKYLKAETTVSLMWVMGSALTMLLAAGGMIFTTTGNLAKEISGVRDANAEQDVKIATEATTQADILRRLEHMDSQLDNIESDLHGDWKPKTPTFISKVASTTP